MNQVISCLQCKDLLDKYLENELDAETYSLLSSHLQDCQECQYVYKLVQVIDDALCDLPSPEPSTELFNKVANYISRATGDSKWEQLTMFDITSIPQSQSQASMEDVEVINAKVSESNWVQITLQDLTNLHREFLNMNE